MAWLPPNRSGKASGVPVNKWTIAQRWLHDQGAEIQVDGEFGPETFIEGLKAIEGKMLARHNAEVEALKNRVAALERELRGHPAPAEKPSDGFWRRWREA